jgi:Dullard-like phosphatase family protein
MIVSDHIKSNSPVLTFSAQNSASGELETTCNFILGSEECIINIEEFFQSCTIESSDLINNNDDNGNVYDVTVVAASAPAHIEISTNCTTGNKVYFSDLAIEFEYVESSVNFQGNYSNYASRTLKSIVPLRNLSYSDILQEKKLILPLINQINNNQNRKTIIFDLDETLIHADFNGNYQNHDHLIHFNYEGEEISVPIFIRPGLFPFLEKVSQIFEIFVFTASKKEYADAVLNFLDPEGKIFKQRFYREHCINVQGRIFVKDLRIFEEFRNLSDIVLVDNSMYSFTNQLSNGVLINSFYHDKEDRELVNLFNYLKQYICLASDVRIVNEKVFNFTNIMEEFATSFRG